MDTQFVDSFVLVAECGSMAEAARRLNLTPTALAQRVRTLERELGVPLFARSGRFVRLTEGGARVLARARHFQQEVRELKHAAASDGFPGGLRIATIRTALRHLTRDLLHNIARSHPYLDVAIEMGASHDLYHQVASGKVDAAVMVEPPFAVPKSLTWRPLRVEPLILLLPRAWRRESSASLLAARPLIRYDRRTWGGSLADRYLQQHGLRPVERFELDSPDGILDLVGLGLGVSLVPDSFSPQPMPSSVVAREVDGGVLARRLGMLWGVGSTYCRLFEDVMPSAPDSPPRAVP